MAPDNSSPGVDILPWEGTGYQPLVLAKDWQVALLNWEPVFDLENAGEIERHQLTDEVFVLYQGQAILFTAAPEGLQVIEMQPGVVYNVRAGTWHNLLATRDASWVIVENRDTHIHDTEIRRMTPDEISQLRAVPAPWNSA